MLLWFDCRCHLHLTALSPLKVLDLFIYNYLFLLMCVDRESSLESRRILDTLELELQVTVSHLTWVLRGKCGSFGKAAGALNCKATSPGLYLFHFYLSVPILNQGIEF